MSFLGLAQSVLSRAFSEIRPSVENLKALTYIIRTTFQFLASYFEDGMHTAYKADFFFWVLFCWNFPLLDSIKYLTRRMLFAGSCSGALHSF